ncbi:hypothetical protein KAR91_17810 [Candidatus Pacearchaeota archaeon]|nr:hypothetical protein [Candidatus Pacearchaeota archaeon]
MINEFEEEFQKKYKDYVEDLEGKHKIALIAIGVYREIIEQSGLSKYKITDGFPALQFRSNDFKPHELQDVQYDIQILFECLESGSHIHIFKSDYVYKINFDDDYVNKVAEILKLLFIESDKRTWIDSRRVDRLPYAEKDDDGS